MDISENPLLDVPQRPAPRRVGVVGAGTIGPDIAYYLKSQIQPLELTLIDISADALERATHRISAYADKGLARGKLTDVQARGVKEGIVASTDYDALEGVDWVIEAATENLELKRRIFADCESRLSADALITSNTSSLPAERIFSQLQHPERATVTHFFAPAFTNPIVEVVNWSKLDRGNLGYLRYLFAATGKVPMVAKDVVCFMLDRIFDNWCNEAAHLLEVASAEEIDSVAQRWVHAGPFFVLNLANGNPIIIETNELQAEQEGDHYTPARVLRSVNRWKTLSPGQNLEIDGALADKIGARLLGILFSQALEIIDRDIGQAADLELGARLAFGFRKGPLELLNEDPARAQRFLDRLAAERSGMPMPARELAAYTVDRRYVLLDDVDGVKVITIRRPEALNALHDGVNAEILALLQQYDCDPATRGFVITGYGRRAFCAGADIGRFPTMLGDAKAASDYARSCSNVLVYMDEMRKPVVAALNGLALGGGLELAMRCHALVATSDAKLQFPEITLGIVPGIGAMVVPFRRWPAASDLVLKMLLKATPVTARDACAAGIVDKVVDDSAELVEAAIRLCGSVEPGERRAGNSPVALPSSAPTDATAFDGRVLSREVGTIMRECIAGAAAADTFAEALELGYRAFGATACTAGAKEGIGAFLEGRTPDFSGTG